MFKKSRSCGFFYFRIGSFRLESDPSMALAADALAADEESICQSAGAACSNIRVK
jgi:hypothetical protein